MTKVLVIDDERDALEVLAWVLLDQGFLVRTAGSAREAIEVGADFEPDLLITDYLLQSDANGLDVIRNLRERQPKLRAILMTGVVASDIATDASALGDIVIIKKPFDWGDLASHLETRAEAIAAND